jgi:uncharacterized membrane protein YtjA (UPF0391 family)
MLRWAVIFLVIALVAALFGFTGIAAAAAGIAKFLFFLFLVICLIFLIIGISAGRRIYGVNDGSGVEGSRGPRGRPQWR